MMKENSSDTCTLFCMYSVFMSTPPPLPRLNKIFTAYIFLAPFRGVVQKYSPKKKNNVHTCTVYNVRKIKVY